MPWTDNEIDTLRRLYFSGELVQDIADALDKNVRTVQSFISNNHLRRQRPRRENPGDTICWKCYNAVPDPKRGRGCSWSMRGEPVHGWDAEEQQIRHINGPNPVCVTSYCVHACKEFIEG